MNTMITDRFDIEKTILIEGPMLLHCGPIFFLSSEEALPTQVVGNGTFGLLDTGERMVLVTCEHVWSDFLAKSKENPHARLAVLLGSNRPVILPKETLIDSNTSLDIATFDMHSLLPECSYRQFFSVKTYPVPLVYPKDILTIIGYLGESRHTCSEGASFGHQLIGVSVSDVSGLHICADLQKTETYRDPDGVQIKPPKHLGGFSGSPCYRIRIKKHAQLYLPQMSLVGFVTSSNLDVLYLTHATCLKPDGTLRTTC